MQEKPHGNPFSGFREIVMRQCIDFGNFKYPNDWVFPISSDDTSPWTDDVNKLSKSSCQYIHQLRYFLDTTLNF